MTEPTSQVHLNQIVDIPAANVTVTDSADYFTGAQVEAILAEIGVGWAKLARENTFTARQNFTGDVYLGGTTNGTKVAAGEAPTLEGTATVWDDLQFGVAAGKTPSSNAPTWGAFTTNTSEYSFTVNDYLDLAANELPHWWKEGTAGNFHIHLAIKTANTSGADRFAKFTVYIATNGGTTWAELSPLSAEVTIPNGAAALTKYYLDMGDATFTGFTIGTQVKVRVKRIAATGGTEYGANVFISQVGCHLEKDSMGSKTEATK